MEKYLINDKAVEFEVFVLSLMACKRVKDRHEVDYLLKMIRGGVNYRYVFKTNKELMFRIENAI